MPKVSNFYDLFFKNEKKSWHSKIYHLMAQMLTKVSQTKRFAEPLPPSLPPALLTQKGFLGSYTHLKAHLPRQVYRPWLIHASMARVMRSPKLAAIGVATLSGLIPVFLDPTITPTIITPKFNKEESTADVSTVAIPLKTPGLWQFQT